MPARSDDPLRRVTLNLYEADWQWMIQHIGPGWSQWIRSEINAEIARLKRTQRPTPARTLGDLADDH